LETSGEGQGRTGQSLDLSSRLPDERTLELSALEWEGCADLAFQAGFSAEPQFP